MIRHMNPALVLRRCALLACLILVGCPEPEPAQRWSVVVVDYSGWGERVQIEVPPGA